MPSNPCARSSGTQSLRYSCAAFAPVVKTWAIFDRMIIGKIIGHRITDTGIARSIDVARLNHIPITPYGDAKRNPYATPQSGPGPALAQTTVIMENSRHDRPETIARMTIIKPHLTRLRTWHGTQHQHARSGIPNRTESMFHTHGPLSYHRIEYRDAPYCITQCCGTTNGRVC